MLYYSGNLIKLSGNLLNLAGSPGPTPPTPTTGYDYMLDVNQLDPGVSGQIFIGELTVDGVAPTLTGGEHLSGSWRDTAVWENLTAGQLRDAVDPTYANGYMTAGGFEVRLYFTSTAANPQVQYTTGNSVSNNTHLKASLYRRLAGTSDAWSLVTGYEYTYYQWVNTQVQLP